MHCCLSGREIITFLCVSSNWFFIPSNLIRRNEGQLCLLCDFSPLPLRCVWFSGFSTALSTQWLCRGAPLPPSLLIFAAWLRAGSDSFVLLLLVSLWCQQCEKWLLCPVAETTVDLLPDVCLTSSQSCFWERCHAAEQQVQATFPSFINKNGTLYRFQNAIISSVFNCHFNKYSF